MRAAIWTLRLVPAVMLVIILSMVLASCTGSSAKQQAFNAWATLCEAYSAALIAAAPKVADGTWAAGSRQDEIISDAQALIGPQCKGGIPDTSEPPSRLLQDVLLRLQGLNP